MHFQNTYSKVSVCPHQCETVRGGVALVTIGNSLRKDDAIAKLVAEALSDSTQNELCRFDLESYSQFLLDCVVFHEVAVIVDATRGQGKTGDVCIIDLADVVHNDTKLKVESCHGLSFLDELKIADKTNCLPDKIYFFGIETGDTDWGEGLSPEMEAKRTTISKRLEEFLKSLFIKAGL